MTYREARRRFKYSWIEPGFLRLSFWIDGVSLMLKFIDTRKHHAVYSERTSGWHFGPFILVATTYRVTWIDPVAAIAAGS